MQLNVQYPIRPKDNSAHASLVMDHFGLEWESDPITIADDLHLPIESGDLVLFTGESGSGKSSLMRAAVTHLDDVVNIDELDLGDRILADALQLPFRESLRLLSACGLGEAALLLRTPDELSDGQRYRYRLALGLSKKPRWLMADEFTATLDRRLAKVIAFNLRKLCKREGIGVLLATTHDDVVSDLQPSLHVQCLLNGTHTVTRLEHSSDDAQLSSETSSKKASASRTMSGSREAPKPTGRTSLAGITDPIASAA